MLWSSSGWGRLEHPGRNVGKFFSARFLVGTKEPFTVNVSHEETNVQSPFAHLIGNRHYCYNKYACCLDCVGSLSVHAHICIHMHATMQLRTCVRITSPAPTVATIAPNVFTSLLYMEHICTNMHTRTHISHEYIRLSNLHKPCTLYYNAVSVEFS